MSSTRSGLLLVSIALSWLMCLAAPHAEFSGDPGLHQFVSKNKEFAIRIKADLLVLNGLVRKAFSFGSNRELITIEKLLGIQQVNISHCQQDPCDMERCFNQIQAGLQTYSGYLSYIRQILTTYSDQVFNIQLDISNLSHNIQQQMEESSLTSVVYPQAENEPKFLEVQREIGSYLVLCKLQIFMDMIFRALRHCST
ncbi:myelomonocytic growth factor-like isoform X1 [Ahaetulla prasina]|uniref:myelomonocytic growth factor-like isoform X1 n=2 Tax=Ahaetulla prasina TaxID=499056 RepID=UPI0026493BBF|nr:myelomonocytic growth factor-like isoform X1 [Ahaetulla prasina]